MKAKNLSALATALVTTLLLALLPSANADVPTSLTFLGKGYGHGVGMSQIGARGMALAGDTATAIMNYYFPNTDVVPLPDDQILQVNVGHQLSTLKITGATAGMNWQVISGIASDTTTAILLAAKDSVTFTIGENKVAANLVKSGVKSNLPMTAAFTIRWSGTRYLDGTSSLITVAHSNKTTLYKYGQLQVKAIKDATLGVRLELINSVRLHDEYLWGVSEVPSSWPAAALEAQAIASRSYALSKAGKIQKSCDCDLYGSISDQVFAGFAKESEVKWGALWKAAVSRTSISESTGLVVARNNIVLKTFFTSSTGGVTETSLNAWGTDVGYTASVPDPNSLDPKLNPNYFKWQRQITQSVLATAFLLPDVASVKILSLNQTGTVKYIEGKSSSGKKVKLTGEIFRSRCKLPSPWFELASVSSVSVQN